MEIRPVSETAYLMPYIPEEELTSAENDLLASLGRAGVALTPGAVIALLMARLNDVDGQIDGMMKEIETNTARSEAVQRTVQGLQNLKAAMAAEQGDPSEMVDIDGDGDGNPPVIVNFEGRDYTVRELVDALELNEELPYGGEHDDTLTGAAVDALIQSLSSKARSMNSNNEVLMVQMQSAMQQRTQAVTMSTNCIKSLNDAESSVVANIGR